MASYIGPCRPIRPLVSKDWYNIAESLDGEGIFKPIDNPCIISGTIEYFNQRYVCIYNKITMTQNMLQCEFVYELEGRATLLRSYIPYSEIWVCGGYTIGFSIQLHLKQLSRASQAKVQLELCRHTYFELLRAAVQIHK